MSFNVETVAGVHISEAAAQLGVTPTHLRNLERRGVIPAPRRDIFGRVYSEDDIALLRAIGVGSNPARLRTVRDVLESSRALETAPS